MKMLLRKLLLPYMHELPDFSLWARLKNLTVHSFGMEKRICIEKLKWIFHRCTRSVYWKLSSVKTKWNGLSVLTSLVKASDSVSLQTSRNSTRMVPAPWSTWRAHMQSSGFVSILFVKHVVDDEPHHWMEFMKREWNKCDVHMIISEGAYLNSTRWRQIELKLITVWTAWCFGVCVQIDDALEIVILNGGWIGLVAKVDGHRCVLVSHLSNENAWRALMYS